MEALMLASHMQHQNYGQHSHKHRLWRSLAMHKLCKLNSLGRAMLNHISSWRERKWERERETCISLMEERSYALIHRVEMEVEVEKMMEEAIAKSLKAWGAPLHSSPHLRVTNDAQFSPKPTFLFKKSGPFHIWADNPSCELSSFN